SFSRTNFGTSTLSESNLVGPRYSLTSGLPVGQINISGGITGFQGLMIPSAQIQTVYTFSDDLYYTRDRHALKLGMLLNRYHLFTQTTAKLLTEQSPSPTFRVLCRGSMTTMRRERPTHSSAVTGHTKPGASMRR